MVTLLSLMAIAAFQPETINPPSVVLILADDLGWGDVGFNGRKLWQTPNLDRLAAGGTVLQRFYASSCICGPSRAALLTGKTPNHCGVPSNQDDLPRQEVTLAEALAPRGYATALFGKWHRGRQAAGATEAVHPMDQGFQSFFGFLDPYHAYEKYPTSLWNGRERVSSSGYADDLFTDHAIDFVRKQGQNRFFLVVSYTAPHFSIEAPPEEVERHRGRISEIDPSHPVNATYAAMVTRLDHNVGRLLQAIEQLRPAGDTLVIFTSDNGATFESGNLGTSSALDSNAPFRGEKRTLWEGGIRVPTVVNWPGHVPAGVVSNVPGQQTDLFPTLLGTTGAKPDPAWNVDGVNLMSAWRGESPAPDRTLFWDWRQEGSNQGAAIRGDYKLVVSGGGPAELYNVAADPGERRNLAEERPAIAGQLHDQYRQWLGAAQRPGLPGDRGGETAQPARESAPWSLSQQILARFGLPVSTAEPKPTAGFETGDLAAIQGRWTARAGRQGKIGVELEVVGDRATFHIATAEGLMITALGSMVLQPGPRHGSLDWTGFRLGSGLVLPTVPSIYRIDGDEFVVCSGGPNGARPTQFIRGDGPLADLVRFRRVSTSRAAEPRKVAETHGRLPKVGSPASVLQQ